MNKQRKNKLTPWDKTIKIPKGKDSGRGMRLVVMVGTESKGGAGEALNSFHEG